MVALAVEIPTERPEPEPPPRHKPDREHGDSGSEANPDWRQKLLMAKDGYTPLPILANALIALREAPEWAGTFALNDFSVAVYSRRSNPAIKKDGDHPWTDAADARLCDWLQHEAIRVSPEVAGRAVLTVADEHRYHPVRDYLQALRWDGDGRLDNWLIEYLGVEPSNYAAAVGRRWMISAVARIMEPGCKVDTCLILEGRQGLKKSTALSVLGGQWFTDQISEIGGRESKQEIRGVWIVEIAELASMKSVADVSKVKAFMTSQRDRFRAPYARHVAEHGRQCVFAGSVNDSQYLRDDTGGRRWWPVACTHIEIDRLREDKDQLWAEAVVRYQEGCPWYLDSKALDAEAEAQQEQRREADPWQHLVEEHLRHNRHVEQWTPEEILQMAIEKRKAEWTKFDRDRVVRILRAMGYELCRPRVGERRIRCYMKPDEEQKPIQSPLM
jgi:predicted P-loop ATPase